MRTLIFGVSCAALGVLVAPIFWWQVFAHAWKHHKFRHRCAQIAAAELDAPDQ